MYYNCVQTVGIPVIVIFDRCYNIHYSKHIQLLCFIMITLCCGLLCLRSNIYHAGSGMHEM